MALIADIIFTQALEHIHKKEADADRDKGRQDLVRALCKEPVDGTAQELRIQKIHDTDESGAQKIQEKYGLIWPVILDKSL